MPSLDYLLVSARPFSPFAGTERRDTQFDIYVGPIIDGLGSHLGFPWPENRHDNLSETVANESRAISGALLGQVDDHVAQLKLLAAI